MTTIGITDDETLFRKGLQMLMEDMAEIEVMLEAGNGQDLLDQLQVLGQEGKDLPDIILLDVVMPKMNGLEITRIIKQDLKISHIPIIAVTGLTKAEDKNKLIEGGFNDYICKPYLIEELESKVYSCLKCSLG